MSGRALLPPQVLTVPIKRVNGEWRAAVVLDNVFKDAMISTNLSTIIGTAISAIVMDPSYEDGTEVTVTVSVSRPSEGF